MYSKIISEERASSLIELEHGLLGSAIIYKFRIDDKEKPTASTISSLDCEPAVAIEGS